jgi:PAS domain S-box-containing protein
VVGEDFMAENALRPWRDEALRRGYRSSTALPLAYESERVGALTMYSGDVTTFTDEELRLLRQLADDVAFGAHALRQRAARGRAIAGREAALQALSSEQGRFRGLIEGSRDLTLIIDRQGAIQFASPASSEIMGLDPAELIGKRVLDHIHPEDHPRARRAMGEVLAAPSAAARVEVRIRRSDGTYALVESGLRNLFDVPGVDGIVINNRDITERNRLREQFQQAQKLESIGRLAGGVAHDFNNLLTVILSCTEIMKESRQAGHEVDDEDIADIHEAGERARDLTRQLLAFARKQIIAPVSLDLNDVVRGAEKLLPRLLGEDVRLKVKLAPDLWPTLCDAGQIEQVLVNLAVNARDAMPGGGTLEIETRNVTAADDDGVRSSERRPGEWVRVIVRDTGSGIPPEVMTHLFEPFFTTKAPGKGTGLGLATVHGIVAQSGGHIHVDSEPGRGTTFQICLPRTVRPQVPRPASPGPTALGGSETVLVVEDDQRVRSMTVRALKERGYTVLAAGGGEEACSLAHDRPGAIDLVVADVVMPGKNGRELVEQLRHGRPGLRALFVSGYTHDAIAQRGVLDSGVEFLSKPFTPATLGARVRELLDRR